MNKEHKDTDVIVLDAPRLTWYKQKVWKKHQDTVYWIDIKFAQKTKVSNFIERHHLLRYAPSFFFPEGYHDGNWRNHLRESRCVTSTSSEDFKTID